MNEDVNRFSFFRSYYEILQDINNPEEGYDFVMKILRYVFDGADPEFKGLYHALWRSIKPNLDSSVSHIRRGAKGGRPSKKPPAAQSETKKKAEQKLAETKPKATEKLNETYEKATEKLSESKTKPDKDKEEDKDKERDMDMDGGKGSKGKTTHQDPPPKEKGKITATDMINHAGLSPRLAETVTEWVRYKTEMRQGYKPTGLKALITQIRNAAVEHGEDAVINLIGQSMASRWQGIAFDRLRKQGGGGSYAYTGQPEMEVHSQYAGQQGRYDYRTDI